MCDYCASGIGYDLTQRCCRVRISVDPQHGTVEGWAAFWRKSFLDNPAEAEATIAEAETWAQRTSQSRVSGP